MNRIDLGRKSIYYWKCDRPASLHGVSPESRVATGFLDAQLRESLSKHFPGDFVLNPGSGKGNHLTYRMRHEGREMFVRVENGPEGDTHLDVESRVVTAVKNVGVPAPKVFFTDATRSQVPFAFQVIEFFDCPDLNQIYREGHLPLEKVAREIGEAVARWQLISIEGFGPFCQNEVERLTGYHSTYETYFRLNLERHLQFLVTHEFLSKVESTDVQNAIDSCHDILAAVQHSCLVHKDLALWNILGTENGIQAFIDWDDAVGGDPTDDLSLLACFHSADVVQAAVDGYATVLPLPENFETRLWLHLLRNMIVKAVIRCGAGYFNQSPGGAFLIAPGQDGDAFRKFTRKRLFTALIGLKERRSISELL